MSHDPVFAAFGRFLVARDRLNAVMDAAIIELTQVRVFHGVLLVSALTTKQRLGVLRTILAQAGGPRAEAALPSLVGANQVLKGHAIGQGTATPTEDGGLAFLRTEVGARTAGAVVTYTAAQVAEAADTLQGHVDALANALGVDDAALERVRRSVTESLSRRADTAEEEG